MTNNSTQFLELKKLSNDQDINTFLSKVNSADYSLLLETLGLSDYTVDVFLSKHVLTVTLIDSEGNERINIHRDTKDKQVTINVLGVYEPQLVNDSLLFLDDVLKRIKYLAKSSEKEINMLSLFVKISEFVAIHNSHKGTDSIDVSVNTEHKNLSFNCKNSLSFYHTVYDGEIIQLELSYSDNFNGCDEVKEIVAHINEYLRGGNNE